MSELLIELFSEEIPARMQVRASDDLRRLMTEGLKARGLETGEARAFSTPRRLVLVVDKVPDKSPAISEEKKGPRVGAPEQAVAGFLKSAGLASLKDAAIAKDDKKGDYYVAHIQKPGRLTSEIIAETLAEVMTKFPWPKSMRWGSNTFQWVRPLHSIICLLGGKVVPFEIAGLKSGAETRGHRFLAPDAFTVKNFADFEGKLEKHKVILDPTRRASSIAEQARALAKDAKLELVEDEALLNENAGLTEWPVVMLGTFDKAFLNVPGECLTTSMKAHQKCFSLRDSKTKKLANKFLLVSNLVAEDGGAAITSGNEKVIRARLSDAKFFWDQDLKRKLEPMHFELKGITFHEKLGSQWDRMERITELARQIAKAVDAEPELAGRAAQLAKADLVSGMVGEFPELQGLMGRYYAEAEHMDPKVARALELHYKPKGPTDSVPLQKDGDSVAIAVALADKLDTLVGFWAINEKPTGSGDPYQLRRAALGVIRIVLENDLRVSVANVCLWHLSEFVRQSIVRDQRAKQQKVLDLDKQGVELRDTIFLAIKVLERFPKADWTVEQIRPQLVETIQSLLFFFADRLKVFLRDQGKRPDLIDAVFSLGGQDDLALIVRRVEALDAFLKTDDGTNLLAGVKRAANILSIEEKKDKKSYSEGYDLKLLKEKEETALAAAIEAVKQDTTAAINVENFAGAMRALAELRGPVDAFFDKILVNADDPKLRDNRLRMLSEIRAATQTVADFSKIAG